MVSQCMNVFLQESCLVLCSTETKIASSTDKDFKEHVEAGPGDYLFVPSNTWHIEENPYDEPSEQFLTRGPDNIVINMGE